MQTLLSSVGVVLVAACASTGHGSIGSRAGDHPPIDLGTFNIRYANDGDGANAWKHRREMVAAILKDGDFWALQEALPSQIADIARDRPEFKVVARTREKDPAQGEACPILYRADRWTLDASDTGTFWLSESPEIAGSKSWDSSLPRICTFARFTAKADEGASLYIFNVHLDHQGADARREAAKLVARRIAARKNADTPFVLLGDFNCGASSAPIKAILGDAPLAARDAWRVAHPDAPEQPTFNGWRERCEGDRIDWIFTAPSLAVERCEIDAARRNGRWPSDHAFVRARVRGK